MRNSKTFFRVAAIAAVLVALLAALDFLLYPCTFMRNDIHAVTTQTFDDIYVGTSHGKMNIDPSSVAEVTGRSGHNLCVGGEYSLDAYYLARLILEKGHAPKRFVYEVSPGYFVSEKEEGNNYLLFYHEFPLSRSKLAYFAESVAKCNLRTMFFPWYEYPLSYELKHLKETVRTKAGGDYSGANMKTDEQEYHADGFIERYPVDTSAFSTDDLETYDAGDIVQKNMDNLSRMIALCREHDIEFVAVMTPLPDETYGAGFDEYEELGAYYNAFFENEGVRFINFNDDEHWDLTDHARENFTDLDGHMHGDAARAFSRVLAAELDPESAEEEEIEDAEEIELEELG